MEFVALVVVLEEEKSVDVDLLIEPFLIIEDARLVELNSVVKDEMKPLSVSILVVLIELVVTSFFVAEANVLLIVFDILEVEIVAIEVVGVKFDVVN